jgi:predicted NBD/HSP70 family sugar kinase
MVSKWFLSQSPGGGPGSLRKVHRALALRELSKQPGISRAELAGRLGLSSMAIGRIVRELEDAGLTGETDAAQTSGGRGRPATGLHLRDQGAYVAGAVISAFSQEAHLLNLCGESVASQPVPLANIANGPKTIGLFCDAITELIANSGIAPERVAGAGFAVAANVDTNHGAVAGGGYLGWSAFDLARTAQRALGLPVTVNNIADALLRAEVFAGCASATRAAVLIHCATLLGASYMANDALVCGARFQAGRIGHFPAHATRLVCSCGQSDCLNCTASGWSILNRLDLLASSTYQIDQVQTYSQLTRALVSGGLASNAKDMQDTQKTKRTMREAGGALARGLRFVELSFDPDMIILAGPLAAHDDYFRGVMKGLQASGPSGANIASKLTRSLITPAQAAGITALLDIVFSPSLDLQRLASAQAGRNNKKAPRQV